jgi:hypothetical protein
MTPILTSVALTSSGWNVLGNLFTLVLFIGPGTLLLARFLKGSRFPWWIVMGLALSLGWISTIGTSYCTTNELSAQINEYESRSEPIPDELMEDWASDAHVVFALFFGWAFAGIVLCPWLIIYAIAHGIRKLLGRTGTIEAEET